MPVYLPPLSRRQFITRTLAAGAGLMLRPSLFAASTPVDPHCWALLSDAHVAADRAKIARGINMASQLTTVVQDVLRQPRRPVGALVNGDLALNSGESADYATFASLIEPLRGARIPLHLGLGNHDNRERFWTAMQADKSVVRAVADRQVAIIPTPRANWFMLDSLDKTLSTPGLLGETQLAWLARELDARRDKPALVIFHHNPSFGGTGKPSIIDQDAVFQVLRPRRHVQAFFFGHSHRWSVTRDESGLHLVNLPTTAYPFDAKQPIGWVIAQLEPRGATVQLRCIDEKRADHNQKVELAWRS